MKILRIYVICLNTKYKLKNLVTINLNGLCFYGNFAWFCIIIKLN